MLHQDDSVQLAVAFTPTSEKHTVAQLQLTTAHGNPAFNIQATAVRDFCPKGTLGIEQGDTVLPGTVVDLKLKVTATTVNDVPFKIHSGAQLPDGSTVPLTVCSPIHASLFVDSIGSYQFCAAQRTDDDSISCPRVCLQPEVVPDSTCVELGWRAGINGSQINAPVGAGAAGCDRRRCRKVRTNKR
ncbi:MAG: hypothetical protein EXR77_10515 [Myxococcales bacterium]|nr:hypothetical protein [Myxococcales bacterium]